MSTNLNEIFITNDLIKNNNIILPANRLASHLNLKNGEDFMAMYVTDSAPTPTSIKIFSRQFMKWVREGSVDYAMVFGAKYQRYLDAKAAVKAENDRRREKAKREKRPFDPKEKVKLENKEMQQWESFATIPIYTVDKFIHKEEEVIFPMKLFWALRVFIKPSVKKTKRSIKIKPSIKFQLVYGLIYNGTVDDKGIMVNTTPNTIILGSIKKDSITDLQQKFFIRHNKLTSVLLEEYKNFLIFFKERHSFIGYKPIINFKSKK